ncbi:MAG: T9SS type A sorting domain-containing protein [Bacteroidota bacterium]
MFFPAFLFPQTASIEWAKCYGGLGNETPMRIIQTSDGGYITGGRTNSLDSYITTNYGGVDFWILRLDENGDTIWSKVYGGSGSDYFYDIIETPGSGFIAMGHSNSTDGCVHGNHGDNDIWLLKLDANGDTLWTKCFGGSDNEWGNRIFPKNANSYIITGSSCSSDFDVSENNGFFDYWIFEIDSSGNILWEKSYGGSLSDYFHSFDSIPGTGFIVCGTSNSDDFDVCGNNGDYDAWIVCLDYSGDTLWSRNYGGSGWDDPFSLKSLSNGYIISNWSNSSDQDVWGNHGMNDFWMIRTDLAGDTIWTRSFGGSDDDGPNDVFVDSDGNFIAAGLSFSSDGDISYFHGAIDMWIIKFDTLGNLLWEKSLGGSGMEFESSSCQTTDSAYVIVGGTYSDDGDVTGHIGDSDFWIVKVRETPLGITEDISYTKASVYPNPANDEFNITFDKNIHKTVLITIVNSDGKPVFYKELRDTHGEIKITRPDVAGGVYFIKLVTENEVIVKKLILN